MNSGRTLLKDDRKKRQRRRTTQRYSNLLRKLFYKRRSGKFFIYIIIYPHFTRDIHVEMYFLLTIFINLFYLVLPQVRFNKVLW